MTSQGEVLTDITTFAFAQRIFNDQKNVEAAYFKNLEFIIQLLLFNEKIWIIQPTYFGKKIEIENPDILTQLINQDIIQVYSPEYYKDTKDFLKSEYLEMIKIDKVRSYLSKNYLKKHQKMKKDLDTYEKWTKLSQKVEAQELANYIGLQKESIPFFANLLRTYMYLKTIDEMKSKYNSNIVISYAPHFLRAPLVDQICYDYRKFSETVIINELEKIEFKEKFERKRIAKEYCADVELDLPMLTTAILKGCGNGKKNEFIDEILNFRNDKNVKKIRNKFIKFQMFVNDGDLKNIKRYESELKKVIQIIDDSPSSRAKLCTVPTINSSLISGASSVGIGAMKIIGTDCSGIVDASSGLSKIYAVLDQYFVKKGDLAFLINLKETLNDVNRSKDEFERVFNTKIIQKI